ncbi:MAG: DUF6783 domain-containing protein [Ruminococcus sp.]|uniref:DUF6783 domain-containing protein n=1 Tax=Clostridia TaxID=186801 RepID=UPI0034A26D74
MFPTRWGVQIARMIFQTGSGCTSLIMCVTWKQFRSHTSKKTSREVFYAANNRNNQHRCK